MKWAQHSLLRLSIWIWISLAQQLTSSHTPSLNPITSWIHHLALVPTPTLWWQPSATPLSTKSPVKVVCGAKIWAQLESSHPGCPYPIPLLKILYQRPTHLSIWPQHQLLNALFSGAFLLLLNAGSLKIETKVRDLLFWNLLNVSLFSASCLVWLFNLVITKKKLRTRLLSMRTLMLCLKVVFKTALTKLLQALIFPTQLRCLKTKFGLSNRAELYSLCLFFTSFSNPLWPFSGTDTTLTKLWTVV